MLSGDRAAFDNTFYVVPHLPHQSTVLYVGGDADDDPHGLHYYLRQALHGNPRRTVNLQACRTDQLPPWSDKPPQLVVVTEALPTDSAGRLTQYLQGGGMVVVVPKNQEAAVSLVSFDQHLVVHPEDNSARSGGYAMLGQIDFTHPLFASFANPQYSDFTQIHFWRHRRVSLENSPTTRVVARFDDGDPALWEQRCGQGRLFVLASGWHPEDSQLALSSKFVPLLLGFLDEAGRHSTGDRHLCRQ